MASPPLSRREFLTRAAQAAVVPSFTLSGCGLPGTQRRSEKTIHSNSARRRLRDLGIRIGTLATGKWNAITDVPGVKVGHFTRIEGSGKLVVGRGPIRTGVTVVFPNDDIYRHNVSCARFVINGNGEMTGLGSVDQRGLLESPVFLTDTSNIGRVMNGAISWLLNTYPEIGDTAPVPVPVVAETWAAFLHDTVGRHIHDTHVIQCIESARSGPVPEGAVGGGTGMVCYDFKGGIGTASRVLPQSHGEYTIGVLVQTNHGDRTQLRIDGVPVGREIPELHSERGRKAKSILLIGATDAPMIPAQLRRLCQRVAFGLARTGAVSSHGSGDLVLFFSTGITVNRDAEITELEIFNDEWITAAHRAAREAAEEAILNSLCAAETMIGIGGNTAHAMPLDRLPGILRRYGRAAR